MTLSRRARAHLAGRGEWWWAPLVYALAVAWIYRGLWHQHGMATGLGWDTIDSYGPDLDFLSRDLAHGRWSWWNPYDHGGYALFADVGFPRWYPVHLAFAGWGAAFGAGWWLIQLEMLAHHVLAGATMHLWLRARGLGRGPAVIGGLTVVSSAAYLIHKASILLWPLAWAPLVLLAIDRVLARPSWRSGAWLGGAVALVGLAGSPPSFMYVLMLVGPYAIVGAVAARASWRALAPALGVAALVAAAGVLITIVPTFELLPLAQRADMKGADFALNAPLLPEDTLLGMIAPYAGNLSASIGVIALALALCALVLRPRADRGLAIVLWATALVGLVLAFGEHGAVLPWLVKHVPPFDLFRAPARYRFLTVFALAACAAHGAHALATAPRAWTSPRVRALIVAAAVLALALVAVYGLGAAKVPTPGQPRGAAWSLVLAAAAAAAVVALAFAPARARPAAFVLIALLIPNDVPFFLHTRGSLPAAEMRRTHDHDDVLASLGDVSVAYRLYDEFVIGERVGPRRGVRDFRGYPAIDPLSQKRYLDVLAAAKKTPEILEAFNVRWVLHAPHFRDGLGPCFVHAPLPPAHFVERTPGVWEALHPAPLAAWYGAIEIAETPAAALAAVERQEAAGGLTTAVVERGEPIKVPPPPDPPPPPISAAVTDYQPDAIDLDVDAPAAGVVVLNEVVYPGWEVTVDDEPAVPLRADYLLRAVAVTPGHHAIAWRFHPTHGRTLVLLYLLAIAAVLAATFLPRRQER